MAILPRFGFGTFYLVPEGLKDELEANGVRILRFDSPAKLETLPDGLAELVGFESAPAR